MPKAKLDATSVLTVSCPENKKRENYWDTIISGFVLEVRETGGKTYYLRYFDQHKRQRQLKIGVAHAITFEQARKAARRLRSEVELGGDPVGTKAEKRAVPSYAEFAQQHLSHVKTYQRSYETTEMYMRVHIIPRWGKCLLTEIEQPDVARWLAEKRASGLAPATVEKIRVIFGRSFELANQWGVAGGKRNPVKGIKQPPINNARHRYLTTEEAERLQIAVAHSRNTQLKWIVGLLLLTGARVSELLHAEWRYIDIDRRTWLIPTSKTGKSRHVPLSQAAIGIIERLPRFDKCPYLLPNPKTKKPFTDIKRPWDTARELAGLNDLRIHDLRHSAASFMINAGIDLYAVGRVLGHANHASTTRYAHLANDTLLAAVEAGADKLAVQWTN